MAHFVDVRDYGADPTGAADSSAAFASAQTAAASSHLQLLITGGTYRLSSNFTFTAQPIITGDTSGGVLLPDSGVVVTFAGGEPLAPTDQYLFGGAGTAKFSVPPRVHPKWWGAKWDGSTDDTAALTAMAAALPNGAGGVMVLPGGVALVTDWTLNGSSGVSDITIEGPSMGDCILRSNTGSTVAPLSLVNIAYSRFRNLQLDAASIAPTSLSITGTEGGTSEFDKIYTIGATTQDILIYGVGAADLSSIVFHQCGCYSYYPSVGHIVLNGQDCDLTWYDGYLYGQSNIHVKLLAGTAKFFGPYFGNVVEWAFELTSGDLTVIGGHAESLPDSSSGLLHTINPGTYYGGPAVEISSGFQDATLGNSGNSILHEQDRPLKLSNFYTGNNITLTHGASLSQDDVTFAPSSGAGIVNGGSGGVVIRGTVPGVGVILGQGEVLAGQSYDEGATGPQIPLVVFSDSLTLSTGTPLVSNLLMSVGTFIVANNDTGVSARIDYSSTGTITILNTNGSAFVTSTPGTGQIQVVQNIGRSPTFVITDAALDGNQLVIGGFGIL